jgi:hypothetical protein
MYIIYLKHGSDDHPNCHVSTLRDHLEPLSPIPGIFISSFTHSETKPSYSSSPQQSSIRKQAPNRHQAYSQNFAGIKSLFLKVVLNISDKLTFVSFDFKMYKYLPLFTTVAYCIHSRENVFSQTHG